MNDYLIWQYNEMKQAGADHADPKRAKLYDQKMQMFRDYKKDANNIINKLNINENHSIIDLGAGTGALTLEIAKKCKTIYAVDVSNEMLKIAKEKAKAENIHNINFVNAGFLTYEHKDKPVDLIITKVAFHHLLDFWKIVAFNRMNSFLAKDGILFLSDIIFSFKIDDYKKELNGFIQDIERMTDTEFAQDAILHFKEEYSTFDWVIEGMIERTNFLILNKNIINKEQIEYICKKRQ